jgi:hypothetical protein
MARKKKVVSSGPKPNDGWVYTTELQINGRNVSPGTELKIAGERGRFRFIQVVNTGEVEWVDVWGGPKGAETCRSFYMHRIKRVHYKNQTVGNLALEYKAKKTFLKNENKVKEFND